MFDDDQIEEAFSNFLPMYLKSCKCSSKDKVSFLEEFVEKLENDLETLEGQIQSQDFHYQRLFFEDPFQLPFDVKIEETIKQMVDFSLRKFCLKT
jgi:Tfp pilus assembly protein PilP